MPKHITRITKDAKHKEILRLFDQACNGQSRWQVWADFIMMAAISISNTVDRSNFEQREKTYLSIAEKYKPGQMDCFAQMLAHIVESLDDNPDQDCLGEMYMGLNLGNQAAGQFFTPYHVCRLMSSISNDDIKGRIEQTGWISVNDCACGAGATLIAFANECRRPGVDVNYQTSVLFTAQDVDLVTGCMCYIQLSLLGCPGYVVIGNTLTSPSLSVDDRGLIPIHGENVWYTPFYFNDIWHFRRQWWKMAQIFHSSTSSKNDERPVERAEVVEEQKIVDQAQTPDLQIKFEENQVGQLMLF